MSQAPRWGRWTLGAYYLHEDMDGAVIIPGNFGGVLPYGQYFSFYYGGGSIETDAYAVYGQATIDLTERLSLTVGGRYSDEKKSEVDLYTDFINSLDFLTRTFPVLPQPPALPTVGVVQFFHTQSRDRIPDDTGDSALRVGIRRIQGGWLQSGRRLHTARRTRQTRR